jgi:hypothetical protein
MKKITVSLLGIILISGVSACEENDTIEKMTDVGNYAANVYFEPINPIASAGSVIETRVEYWSEDDEFESITLLQNLSVNDKITFDLEDVNYEYRYDENRLISDNDEVESIQHNFTSFFPQRNSYVINVDYTVLEKFAKNTFNSRNSDKQLLANTLPQEIKTDFFSNLASGLSYEQLTTILVETHGVVSQNTLEGYYQEGSLTDSGRENVIGNLSTIGIPALIANNFSYEQINRISLYFSIVNGLGEESTSALRSFNVN